MQKTKLNEKTRKRHKREKSQIKEKRHIMTTNDGKCKINTKKRQ